MYASTERIRTKPGQHVHTAGPEGLLRSSRLSNIHCSILYNLRKKILQQKASPTRMSVSPATGPEYPHADASPIHHSFQLPELLRCTAGRSDSASWGREGRSRDLRVRLSPPFEEPRAVCSRTAVGRPARPCGSRLRSEVLGASRCSDSAPGASRSSAPQPPQRPPLPSSDPSKPTASIRPQDSSELGLGCAGMLSSGRPHDRGCRPLCLWRPSPSERRNPLPPAAFPLGFLGGMSRGRAAGADCAAHQSPRGCPCLPAGAASPSASTLPL